MSAKKKEPTVTWTIPNFPRDLKNRFMGRCHNMGKTGRDRLIELLGKEISEK